MVLDKTEYTSKAQEHLEDGVMYNIIKTDPTVKEQNGVGILSEFVLQGNDSEIVVADVFYLLVCWNISSDVPSVPVICVQWLSMSGILDRLSEQIVKELILLFLCSWGSDKGDHAYHAVMKMNVHYLQCWMYEWWYQLTMKTYGR